MGPKKFVLDKLGSLAKLIWNQPQGVTMTNITANTIREAITNKGATFFSATTVTDARLKKTGNPFGKVLKHSRVNGIIGFDYEAGVNRLAAKEGKEAREAKPRAWGEISEDKIFVEHKGATYLRTRIERTLEEPRYFREDNGEELTKEQVAPFLPAKRKSSTQADLEGEIVECDYKLESLTQLKLGGQVLTTEIEDHRDLVEGLTV
jgi:hypothetical protein